MRSLLAAGCLVLAFVGGEPALAQVDVEVSRHIAGLRGIRTTEDKEALKQLNQSMDAAWRYFDQNRAAALPVIRREVSVELAKPARDSFFLLDLGYFLLLNDRAASAKLAVSALGAVDPADDVVQWNFAQMYKFTALAATTGDGAVLTFLDKAYLPNERTLHYFWAPNLLQVSPDMLCAYLYGALGDAGERHLLARLEAGAPHGKRALEALNIMGSELGVKAVAAYLGANPDHEVLLRGVGVLMRTGGPRGRDALLGLELGRHEQRTRDYMERIREEVRGASFDVLRRRYERAGMPGDTKLSDAELRARLTRMYERYGRDDETNPLAVLDSSLPANELIAELKRIRQRTFQGRPSNTMIQTVKITTDVINTLQYRTAGR